MFIRKKDLEFWKFINFKDTCPDNSGGSNVNAMYKKIILLHHSYKGGFVFALELIIYIKDACKFVVLNYLISIISI